jgi:glycerophosphoryl diester phosphodiesterase
MTPAVFAHRGVTEGFVENTIEAFVEAARVGADGVELDVRRSRDGALVVHHDAAIDGTAIADLAAGELPTHVPLLGAALDACHGMVVNVEVKNNPAEPGWDDSDGLARAVAAEVIDAGWSARVVISSFDAATIEAVRAAEPGIEIGWLIGPAASLDEALRMAVERRYDALHPFFSGLDAAAVRACHEAGVAVRTWTPNAPKDLRAVADLGVDALVTDRVATALALLAD